MSKETAKNGYGVWHYLERRYQHIRMMLIAVVVFFAV